MADHAMPAHGREGRHLRVGNLFCFPFKAKGVAYAVPVETGVVTATLRVFNRRRYVDAHAQILFFDPLDELLRSVRIVEDSSARSGNGKPLDYALEVRLHIPIPVSQRSQVL